MRRGGDERKVESLQTSMRDCLEPMPGFEPGTYGLRNRAASTASELNSLIVFGSPKPVDGKGPGNRLANSSVGCSHPDSKMLLDASQNAFRRARQPAFPDPDHHPTVSAKRHRSSAIASTSGVELGSPRCDVSRRAHVATRVLMPVAAIDEHRHADPTPHEVRASCNASLAAPALQAGGSQ